ncbi:MAG: nicotinate (nicotinamide) nucleotide adenylyltransferase [Rikenellaceae bacterium]
MSQKRVMLYFGSFNPIHRGHIALAEYVVEQGLCDELIMVVSPQNPLKESSDLAPELERFTMAELACGESKYSDRIKPSLIEFMLPKPSYTINTLRHLTSEYGAQMSFSILMGGDIIAQFHKWRDYEEILRDYPIYLYPREGEVVDRYLDRITILEGAPMFDVSSSQVRRELLVGGNVESMIPESVAKHIASLGLWREPTTVQHFVERGKWHYQHERWGEALNDFNRALAIDPSCVEASEFALMARQILEFRYTDIYNP